MHATVGLFLAANSLSKYDLFARSISSISILNEDHSSASHHSHQNKYLKLLPYEIVREKITEAVGGGKILEFEIIPVETAIGRTSAEQIRSKLDLPRWNQSAMDGYALKADETHHASTSAPVNLVVTGSLYPSSKAQPRLSASTAYNTATGAPIPVGADAVVKVEETRLEGDHVSILRPITRWKNVFVKGEDFAKGKVLFEKGRTLNSSDVALLISAGVTKVRVVRKVKVGILSIGDELTSLDNSRKGKEKKKTVNNYFHLLSGYLSEFGAIPSSIGICRDNKEEIAKKISGHIKNFELLLTIGGSSVGEKDLTVDALSSLPNSKLIFHGVRIVPIRPAGLAVVRGKPVVIVPANVISAALSCFLVVRPVLNALSGLPFEHGSVKIKAISETEFGNHRPISALFLTRVHQKDGTFLSNSLGFSSNINVTLSESNSFIELAPYEKIPKGAEIVVSLLGASELTRIATD